MKVKVIQAWLVDHLSMAFVVELPTWTGWSQVVDGIDVRGVAPGLITMWAPSEALLMSKEAQDVISQVRMKALTSSVPCTV